MAKKYYGGKGGSILPSGTKRTPYPKNNSIKGSYDDTIVGIDSQINADVNGANKNPQKREKY